MAICCRNRTNDKLIQEIREGFKEGDFVSHFRRWVRRGDIWYGRAAVRIPTAADGPGAARPNGELKAGEGLSGRVQRGGDPSWSGRWRGRNRRLDLHGGGAGQRGRSSGQGERRQASQWPSRPGQIDAVLSQWTGQHLTL